MDGMSLITIVFFDVAFLLLIFTVPEEAILLVILVGRRRRMTTKITALIMAVVLDNDKNDHGGHGLLFEITPDTMIDTVKVV